MTRTNNFVATWMRVSGATVLALLAGSVAACQRTPDRRDVATTPPPQPEPTRTVVISPTPQPAPTRTVVVSPAPQPAPTQTVVVSPSPQPAPTTAAVPREPITNLVVIAAAPNQELLAGKRVQFTNVRVRSVVGDRTFWVGPNNTQKLFVVLAPPLDEGSAEERIVVREGQTLNLTGVLKILPNPQQAQQQWDLSSAEAQELNGKTLYMEAEQIKFK
ncbi:hypothetical protein [Kamptonema formosum]|uniref:hypothetical protein n=1 Tax=Kamptonema formosum TaxID=331992 RepID=UPI000377E51F|nr:hypothetical protein [Oscillatoria sp. PCC 10802]